MISASSGPQCLSGESRWSIRKNLFLGVPGGIVDLEVATKGVSNLLARRPSSW